MRPIEPAVFGAAGIVFDKVHEEVEHLNEILLMCYQENYQAEDEPDLIAPSLAYLAEHLGDPALSISELAARSFVSEVYFRKLFRKKFGISPQKYIIRQRIRRAMDLMSTGYYSLGEVSALSGYTDYAYFCSEFKRLCGVCPTEYLSHPEAADTENVDG